MKNKFFRTFAVTLAAVLCTLAAVLCFTAFSTTAFAGGADPDPAPLPEETGTPTTGGIELDTEDAEGFAGGADPAPAPLPEETGTPTTGGIELDTEDAEGDNNTSSTTEDTENTENKESTGTAETMTDEEMADLLSSLLGSQVDVTVTDEGIQLTNKDDGTPNLNVRTGAGTDNQAFTQLPNGTQVEVIGTEDNGWVKILLPEREGYVCGDYLTVSDAATSDGDFSLTLNRDELSALLEQFGGSAGGSAALTPDGNLSLIDDIGTTGGKQFITLQTKAGNTFYLIIDQGNRAFPEPSGRSRPDGLDRGRRNRPGDLYLYGEMRGRGRQHRLPGMQGQSHRLRGRSAGSRGTGRTHRTGGRSRKQHGRLDCIPCGAAHWRRCGPLLLQV